MQRPVPDHPLHWVVKLDRGCIQLKIVMHYLETQLHTWNMVGQIFRHLKGV